MIPTHERKLARTLLSKRTSGQNGRRSGSEWYCRCETINVEITGDDLGVLIGRRGQTLDTLQYLTGLSEPPSR